MYPILPLRDIVVFPHMIVPLFVGREKSVRALEDVMQARQATMGASSPTAQVQADAALGSALGRLFAVAEAYPDLKANESFLALQARITTLENGIADRREVYNDAVNINNVRLEQFPASLVASFGDFRPQPMLHFSSAETSDPDVKALFA